MRSLERLTTCFIAVGGLVVALSYFLPHEDLHWSPFLMAQGYMAGGGYLDGPVVAGFETAPAICGLLFAVIVLLRVSPRLESALLGGFLAVWLSLAVLYAIDFFSLPALSHPALWGLISLLVLASVAGLGWHLFLRSSRRPSPLILELFVAGCLFLSQIVSVAFIVMEDGSLLNYGAVTSSVGATVLMISVVFRHQLRRQVGTLRLGAEALAA